MLNDREKAVLQALARESENYGHDFGITDDVVLPQGITPKQFSGYMSQLVQKGYVWVHDNEGSCDMAGQRLPAQFELTPKALEVIGCY